jgi:hypothetical protein
MAQHSIPAQWALESGPFHLTQPAAVIVGVDALDLGTITIRTVGYETRLVLSGANLLAFQEAMNKAASAERRRCKAARAARDLARAVA